MSSASELCDITLTKASELLREKTISPVELTRACLERMERLDGTLNAFITVTDEWALQQARVAEDEIANGRYRGPLHGIPVALKDLIDTAGVRTTAASALFQDRVPSEDATVVRRLKVEGAVLLGKTNLHEFAYGGSGVVSYYGAVRNPWAREHIAGGSSSGAAAAVASGMCFAAIGTDTAGSIRLPAACCGIVGLKPTYGLVSARGVIPLAWSYDHVGPLTRSVADAALVLQAIAGYDAGDITSRELPEVDYAEGLEEETHSLRLGIVRQFFFDDLETDVAAAINNALQVLETLTYEMSDASLPIDTDRTVQAAESYAYHESFIRDHAEHYQPETLRRLQRGESVTAREYILKRNELDQLRKGARDLFSDYDLLVTPASPAVAPALADLQVNPDDLRRRELILLRNTRPFNVLGLPAISVPCGFSRAGLPIGLQIAGAPGDDARVLLLAHKYEQATEWHKYDCGNGEL
ncbi:MAG TPA: amidase [Terriglobales bacterium]|jgi:aspartyl-tRNA(Asn)/glutamyl-tRNA(Gln) amidotransferase subunit A|nr:amidase [Terriglobales bacterium]